MKRRLARFEELLGMGNGQGECSCLDGTRVVYTADDEAQRDTSFMDWMRQQHPADDQTHCPRCGLTRPILQVVYISDWRGDGGIEPDGSDTPSRASDILG